MTGTFQSLYDFTIIACSLMINCTSCSMIASSTGTKPSPDDQYFWSFSFVFRNNATGGFLPRLSSRLWISA